MYYFISDYGIIKIEWVWTEIERRAWRYAEEERLDDFHEHEQGKYWVYIAIGHNVGIVG